MDMGRQPSQIVSHRGHIRWLIPVSFRFFRAEGAFSPIASTARTKGQYRPGGKIPMLREEVCVIEAVEPLFRLPAGPAQGKQHRLARAGDQIIDKPRKGVAETGDVHPGGNEPPAQQDARPGQPVSDKSGHGKPAYGLVQIIDRNADRIRLPLDKRLFQSCCKAGVKRIVFKRLCGLQ